MTTGMMNAIIKETEKIQNNCEHEKLKFGSGGFYIFCSDCEMTWVAKKFAEEDDEIDYERNNLGNREYRLLKPMIINDCEENPL